MALKSPDSEPRLFRSAGPGLRFFMAAILSVSLMYMDHRSAWLDALRSGLGAALYPVHVVVDAPFSGLRWLRHNLALRRTLVADNEELRRALLVTSAAAQRLTTLEAENARLRALLDSTARIPDRVTVAEVMAVDMDPLRHRVIINRGGNTGAREGQALIDDAGVVGQVTRDQRHSAEVILITDPDHAIPVEILRNGLRTIAVGTGDIDALSLPFLTRNADVEVGDVLVTSGLGGAFPPGYPVGHVTTIDRSGGEAFLEVSARPSARLDRLHEVLLVFHDNPNAAPPAGPGAAP